MTIAQVHPLLAHPVLAHSTAPDYAATPDVYDLAEIHRGNRLAMGESIVWQGRPVMRATIRDVFHARTVLGYFGLLLAADAVQAWGQGLPLAQAVHDSVPLVLASVLAIAIFVGLAIAVARSTRYILTDRRVILRYGIAMPAVLSLPFSQISSCAVSVRRDHTGEVLLVLKSTNRMPFLKLWPLARPWYLAAPQPMLRAVPQAAVVASLLARALQASDQARPAERRPEPVGSAATIVLQPELMTA